MSMLQVGWMDGAKWLLTSINRIIWLPCNRSSKIRLHNLRIEIYERSHTRLAYWEPNTVKLQEASFDPGIYLVIVTGIQAQYERLIATSN